MRIMSGIQPTGSLHIGNYLGAIARWVELQSQHEVFYAIVDLHALTAQQDPAELRRNVHEMAIGLLASGIDPERAVLFVQSRVFGHTELAWILSCMTQFGDLSRMTQFKDKSRHDPDNINVGLFSYPVLQMADILIYRAEGVPVGEDQVQHLELARETVRRFNNRYGRVFPEPEPLLTQARRIIGLDGETKMSKSRGNEIGLFEEPNAIMAKLRGAKTDPARKRRSDPGNPEVCNIYSLHRYFTEVEMRSQVDRDCRAAAIGCVDCKKILASRIEAAIGPIRARAAELRCAPEEVEAVLARGAERAQCEAGATMEMVRERVGLG